MTTQTELAKQAYLNGDWHGALRIMHTWDRGLGQQDKEILRIAWNCIQSPALYQQMGYDCEECIERSKAVIAEYFKDKEESMDVQTESA